MNRLELNQEREVRPLLAYAYPFYRYRKKAGIKVDVLEGVFREREISPADGNGTELVPVHNRFIYNHYPNCLILVFDRDMPVLVTQDGIIWVPGEISIRRVDEIKLPYHFGIEFENIRAMMEKYIPDVFIKLTVRNG